MKIKNKNRKASEKYALGDFVLKNQQNINSGLAATASLGAMTGNEVVTGATSGLAAGASLGTAIMPGIGTAIGAVGGALLGGITGGKKQRAAKAQKLKENNIRAAEVADQYESELDLYNENPYGVYEDGGDINSEVINIEKGELQIDPSTGKILREFKGINPETGGKYESHNNKGKDTKNNMVTAEVGTFIITAKEGKKYKDAVDNNDKLAQNTIMANIRNKKREASKKYATGGDIYDPLKLNPLVNTTGMLNIPNRLNTNAVNFNTRSNITAPSNSNIGSRLGDALNYVPAITNIAQSLRSPDYLQYRPTRMNIGLRQRTLASLPNEVSINPALNTIQGSIRSVDRDILNSTSNSSVSRALRQANAISGRRSINEAYINNAGINNNIRMNNAGVYSNLAAQDQQRSAQNAQMMLGVDSQNRQMDLAKQQQLNYGISQTQQMAQALRSNRLKESRDLETIELMKQIFPNAAQFFNNYGGGRNG